MVRLHLPQYFPVLLLIGAGKATQQLVQKFGLSFDFHDSFPVQLHSGRASILPASARPTTVPNPCSNPLHFSHLRNLNNGGAPESRLMASLRLTLSH